MDLQTCKDSNGEFLWTRDEDQGLAHGMQSFVYYAKKVVADNGALSFPITIPSKVFTFNVYTFHRLLSFWNRQNDSPSGVFIYYAA